MGFNLAAVDTNVLLRIAMDHGNNKHHSRAKSLVKTPGMYFTVLDQAILEMEYILRRKEYNLSRFNIVAMILAVLAEPRLDYNEKLFKKVFDLYLAHPKLSLTDCYMAYKSEELEHTPLYTFDEKLVKQFPSAKLVP